MPAARRSRLGKGQQSGAQQTEQQPGAGQHGAVSVAHARAAIREFIETTYNSQKASLWSCLSVADGGQGQPALGCCATAQGDNAAKLSVIYRLNQMVQFKIIRVCGHIQVAGQGWFGGQLRCAGSTTS